MNKTKLDTTITAGGTAQSLSTLVGRRELFICNPDPSEDLWIAFFGTTAAPNGLGSIRIAANGGTLTAANGEPPSGPISVYGATTGHKLTGWET